MSTSSPPASPIKGSLSSGEPAPSWGDDRDAPVGRRGVVRDGEGVAPRQQRAIDRCHDRHRHRGRVERRHDGAMVGGPLLEADVHVWAPLLAHELALERLRRSGCV